MTTQFEDSWVPWEVRVLTTEGTGFTERIMSNHDNDGISCFAQYVYVRLDSGECVDTNTIICVLN